MQTESLNYYRNLCNDLLNKCDRLERRIEQVLNDITNSELLKGTNDPFPIMKICANCDEDSVKSRK